MRCGATRAGAPPLSRRREPLLERERPRTRPLRLEFGKLRLGFFDRRDVAFGDPPEDGERVVFVGEPFASAAVVIGVARVERVLEQRLDIFPDAEVDEDAVVVPDSDGGGVAFFGLVAPDEAGGFIGEAVYFVDAVFEVGDPRVIERCDEPGEVVLGQVVRHGRNDARQGTLAECPLLH